MRTQTTKVIVSEVKIRPFNLEEYLTNPSLNIVTRDRRKVRIVCTDAPNKKCPIYGFVEGDEGITSWKENGKFSSLEDSYDLFFADKEEEMTEFEKKFIDIIKLWISGNTNPEENLTQLQFDTKQLLDLARKEFQSEIDKEISFKVHNEMCPTKANDKKHGGALKERMKLINALKECGFTHFNDEFTVQEALDWLEKQSKNDSIEQVFRPLAGCDIDEAAEQAVNIQKQGKNIVLAFNGAYIPVKGKTTNEIFDEYISWLEKQGEKDSQLIPTTITFDDILALQCCMEIVEKVQKDKDLYEQLRSLHNKLHYAYWLEKQGEQKPVDGEELSRLATKKAYNVYPMSENNMCNNEWNAKRVGYKQGYEQAVKDVVFKNNRIE